MQKLLVLAIVALSLIAAEVRADTPPTKYIRLSLAVMEYGDCYVKVEETSASMSSSTKFQGEPATLSRFPTADVLKAADGSYRIIHSFDKADELKNLFFYQHNVDLDLFKKTLALKAGKDNRGKASYWFFVRPPLVICYDRLPIPKDSGIVMWITSERLGSVGFNLMRSKEDKTLLGIDWLEKSKDGKFVADKDGKVTENHILSPTEIDLEKGYETKVRLPLPNAHIDNPFKITFDAWSNDQQKTDVAHFLVQGHLCPMIGIGFKESTPYLFIEKTIAGSACEKAGINVGDVVVSINGQEPKSVGEAIQICEKSSVGDELTFKIKRADQEQEIKVKLE